MRSTVPARLRFVPPAAQRLGPGDRPKISLHAPPAADEWARGLTARAESAAASPARLLVKIDLKALHANLAATWRRPPSHQEVRDFLAAAGFVPVADGWTATEESLMRLDPSEILSAEPVPPAAVPLARAS
jgi:hypothetical protein